MCQDSRLDVFKNGQSRKNINPLKGATQAKPAYLVGWQAGCIYAIEDDPAPVQGQMTRDHVKKGGFSCSIWADDGAYLSFFDLKADPCNGYETIE